MKEWKRLRIGSFNISSGKHFVTLKALKIGHENVAEIYGLRLTLLDWSVTSRNKTAGNIVVPLVAPAFKQTAKIILLSLGSGPEE